MSPIPRLRRALLAALALCSLCAAARAQNDSAGLGASIPKLGGIRGLTTLRAWDAEAGFAPKSFLAVWYFNPRPDHLRGHETFLVIFEPQREGYREAFRYDDKGDGEGWSEIAPLDAPRLPGLYIKISGISDYDSATVVALVGGEFRVVFEGSTSEFVDLDGDGFAEIFESDWPDGDGHPKTTRVHAWDGKAYKLLTRAAFRRRFGLPVLRAVERAARRTRPAKRV